MDKHTAGHEKGKRRAFSKRIFEICYSHRISIKRRKKTMINLLPQENQREISQEQNWKMIMILGILVLVFLICLSLILFSIEAFVSADVEAQKIQFQEREKVLNSPGMRSLESDLAEFNKKIFQLESFYRNQLNISDSLAKISTVFPSGTYLNNLSINLQPNENGPMEASCNLSGFSSTRENLLVLKANLEKEESFKDVYFPPADWMNATSINFTASFKFK
jgi:Tfp pilus assembly protein PilN